MTDGFKIYNSQLDAFDLYHKVQEDPGAQTTYLNGPALPSLGHAVAGAIGASISNVCVYPLALVVTRLQTQRQQHKLESSTRVEGYNSIKDVIYKICKSDQGIAGFYVGLSSDTTKTIADSFLFFLAYDSLRRSRLRSTNRESRHLPVLEELSIGFLAGAFSKLLTTPLANVVTRQQTAHLHDDSSAPHRKIPPSSIRSTIKDIVQEKGLQGLWSGYSASLVLTLNPSLTFFFFETLKWSTLPRSRRSKPSARETFLLAALSKALASTLTYPFSLAKTRLQSRSATTPDRDEKEQNSNNKAEIGGRRRKDQGTVFKMILRIAQEQGIGALYEGLRGEVLKGFFSHGITMLAKDMIHKLVVQMFYALLKLLRKYPSPQELAELARQRAEIAAVETGHKIQKVTGAA